MGYHWDVFEPIDEFVYAVDPKTYALRYMNPALRNMLALKEDYAGKPCYAVLQGRSTPCALCRHMSLEREGQTQKIGFFHPVQQRQYDVAGTLVRDGDALTRLMVGRPVGGATAFVEAARERLLHECLQEVMEFDDFDDTIDAVLAFMGKRFSCGRAYIFEIVENGRVCNTYEWCAPGVAPEKEFLQDEPIETIETWMRSFREDRPVMIEDILALREEDPALYAVLKPQGIQSLLCWPLRDRGKFLGFVGLDDPVRREFPVIFSFFRLIEYFLVSWIRRRDAHRELEQIAHHDPLTGAYNRLAFRQDAETFAPSAPSAPWGVLYCNLLCMRHIAGRTELAEGDDPVQRCYRLLAGTFAAARIYRISYHEFAVVCLEMEAERLEDGRRSLLRLFADAEVEIAIGVASSGAGECDLIAMLARAAGECRVTSPSYYRAAVPDVPEGADQAATLQEYLHSNPVGVELLMEAVSEAGSPVGLFFGDMRTDRYYITNNIREAFDFEGSVVNNLLERWADRICMESDREIYLSDLTRVRDQEADDHDFKYRVFTAAGEPTWVHSRAVISYDEDGQPRYAAGFVTRQESAFDPITGFAGKEEALRRMRNLCRSGQETHVLGVGLNNFSEINEAIGRNAADILLRDIAQDWEHKLGKKIWFYRLDGVRFAAVINPVCADALDDLVAEIRAIVEKHCLRQRAALEYPCSICAFRHGVEAFWEPEELLGAVIMFIEVAKADRTKPYILYSEKEQDLQRTRAELLLHLNNDVRAGYRNFRIVIQPIVAPATGKITGGEVLLRWRHGEKDISPGVFVPLLEKSGLIRQVGRWVFERAAQQCRRLAGDHPGFHLSCNVSYFQLSDKGFVPFVRDTVAHYGLAEYLGGDTGVHLVMELTETHFDEYPELLNEFITSCREMGILVSLDDFGSGYSSLSLLMKYPVDIVKIDRGIMQEMSDTVEKRKFIKTLIFACHEIGRRVCVEGVETAEDVRIVQDTEGDMAQGFYFYRPLDLEDFYRALYQNAE